tara:strand:- start:177 stop:884 length:708 start_codon:yes stop_codon:yes gene_type:complete
MPIERQEQQNFTVYEKLEDLRNVSGDQITGTSGASFMAKARTTEFAFTERFEVLFSFPASLKEEWDKIQNSSGETPNGQLSDLPLEATLLCEEIQIPGMTLSNKEQQVGNWTFYRNTNMGFLGNEINITFYTDVEWKLRSLFEAWMAHCVNPTSKQVAFPDDQFGQVWINQLGKDGRVTATWELSEVTPKVLNLVPLAMGAISVARTTLIVSSAYWESKAIDVNVHGEGDTGMNL